MLTACGGGASKPSGDAGGGGDKPTDTSFHYKVIDDGNSAFHDGDALDEGERDRSGQYVGLYANGDIAWLDARLPHRTFDFGGGDYSNQCWGVKMNQCVVNFAGRLHREKGMRYRYSLGDVGDHVLPGRIAFDRALWVGLMPQGYDKVPTLVVGKRISATNELTVGNYRMLLRQCPKGKCEGSDLMISIAAEGPHNLSVAKVDLLGGAQQTLIHAGMKLISQARKSPSPFRERWELTGANEEPVADVLAIPLSDGGKALTLGIDDTEAAHAQVSALGIAVLQQPQPISSAGIWRGWSTDGKPGYARTAMPGETTRVVDDIVPGNTIATSNLHVLPGGPMLATLSTDTGEMFVGLKELDTVVPDPDEVDPELSPGELK